LASTAAAEVFRQPAPALEIGDDLVDAPSIVVLTLCRLGADDTVDREPWSC
jgi:hypothetical protein